MGDWMYRPLQRRHSIQHCKLPFDVLYKDVVEVIRRISLVNMLMEKEGKKARWLTR